MTGQEGREGEAQHSPARHAEPWHQAWATVQPILSLVAIVAESQQHEALAMRARALALLGELAVVVCRVRRR